MERLVEVFEDVDDRITFAHDFVIARPRLNTDDLSENRWLEDRVRLSTVKEKDQIQRSPHHFVNLDGDVLERHAIGKVV